MVYLEQDTFMTELSKLYAKRKKNGSVWVTMKRVTGRDIFTGKRKLGNNGPVCLVRATDGKTKIACAVEFGEHVGFHMDLFTVIQANTEALKKTKRNRTKKGASAA